MKRNVLSDKTMIQLRKHLIKLPSQIYLFFPLLLHSSLLQLSLYRYDNLLRVQILCLPFTYYY